MLIPFATILDFNYLSRCLTLYESIRQHHNSFVLYVICLDDKTWSFFRDADLDNLEIVSLSEIEAAFPELEMIKKERSTIDYIFTLSPYYPLYILSKNNALPFICSLDCDQFFFSSSETVLEKIKDYSVLITPHRFPPNLMHLEIYGRYNVSFQAFKNNKVGKDCLELWRSQCRAWCSDVLTDGKFADQKYLDEWENTFHGEVLAINHPGVGLAPWNISDKQITKCDGQVKVQGENLILYHYQSLRIVGANLINTGLEKYAARMNRSIRKFIYQPIINALYRHAVSLNIQDGISRNAEGATGSVLNRITGFGFLYRVGNSVFSLDKIYRLIQKFK